MQFSTVTVGVGVGLLGSERGVMHYPCKEGILLILT